MEQLVITVGDSPDDIVARFADTIVRCLTALSREYIGFERPAVGQPMALRTREAQGTLRSGALEGIGRFQIHGRGCRFELMDGAEVDVDWAEDGRVQFDSWKILMFARSVGRSSIDRDALRAAAGTAPTIEQIDDDSFTIAGDDFTVSWGQD
ncbi:hypothetical protein EDM22_12125 [Agromyces tardus]|uniref:DUF6896 domain-containing protein n=1 Tax=Agromyces tardus TaxID=2583849 RepID=A0A3M8A913_9MICO|nr:hypothetical protein [Agromyces tardus]RNB47604.1 hypothetical protein EDM22_12125 [Agromyces tardus]